MRIALYERVSTEEQAKEGFSIEHQKQRLAAYCESQGWSDYEHFTDDGYSGTNMDRPQLKRLLRRIDRRMVDMVVVYRLDRLSRKQKDTLYLLEDVFNENNVAFKSATEPFDTSTPLGKAMLGILAVFAQLERDTIVERVTDGKRERTRQGLWYGGPVPFGYRWDTEIQQLIVEPKEAELMRQAFERVLNGQSYRGVGQWLDKRDTSRLFSHHKTILYLLTNPIYCGKLNQNGILVNGQHEAIISADTWEAVQKEMKQRKSGRKPYGHYLLSNLLTCAMCGSSLRHINMNDRRSGEHRVRSYYVCSTKRTQSGPACTSSYLQADVLEETVLRNLREKSIDREQLVQSIRQELSPDIGNTDVIDQLTSELERIDAEIERWYDAYGSGSFDRSRVSQRIAALEDEKRAVLVRLDDIDVVDDEPSEDAILDALETIDSAWDDLTEEERSSLLRLAIRNITVHDAEHVEFEWNI